MISELRLPGPSTRHDDSEMEELESEPLSLELNLSKDGQSRTLYSIIAAYLTMTARRTNQTMATTTAALKALNLSLGSRSYTIGVTLFASTRKGFEGEGISGRMHWAGICIGVGRTKCTHIMGN